MTRLGIMLSGRGSNFLAIHAAVRDGVIPNAEIAVVLSNNAAARGLTAALELGLTAFHVPLGDRNSPDRDAGFIAKLKEYEVDLVCLAGYMRIVSPAFVAAFPHRVLNMHPSLLPSFKGLHPHRQAVEYGAKYAGCTVHFVDELLDHGVIVMQRAVPVLDSDTEDTVAERVLVEEHKLFPEAIARVLSGEYEVQGRRYVRRV